MSLILLDQGTGLRKKRSASLGMAFTQKAWFESVEAHERAGRGILRAWYSLDLPGNAAHALNLNHPWFCKRPHLRSHGRLKQVCLDLNPTDKR